MLLESSLESVTVTNPSSDAPLQKFFLMTCNKLDDDCDDCVAMCSVFKIDPRVAALLVKLSSGNSRHRAVLARCAGTIYCVSANFLNARKSVHVLRPATKCRISWHEKLCLRSIQRSAMHGNGRLQEALNQVLAKKICPRFWCVSGASKDSRGLVSRDTWLSGQICSILPTWLFATFYPQHITTDTLSQAAMASDWPTHHKGPKPLFLPCLYPRLYILRKLVCLEGTCITAQHAPTAAQAATTSWLPYIPHEAIEGGNVYVPDSWEIMTPEEPDL